MYIIHVHVQTTATVVQPVYISHGIIILVSGLSCTHVALVVYTLQFLFAVIVIVVGFFFAPFTGKLYPTNTM